MDLEEIQAIRERIKEGGNEYALTRMAYDLVVVLDALEATMTKRGFYFDAHDQSNTIRDVKFERG